MKDTFLLELALFQSSNDYYDENFSHIISSFDNCVLVGIRFLWHSEMQRKLTEPSLVESLPSALPSVSASAI